MRLRVVAGFVTVCALGAQADPGLLAKLHWLEGRWLSVNERRTVEESWLPPLGNSMLGTGRTVRGDSLVEHEVVFLRTRGSKIVYEAHPSGQEPAEFVSIDLGPDRVVFENAAHDFPQRVGYRRAGGDSLYAWIEGTMDGKPRRIEFRYARAAAAE